MTYGAKQLADSMRTVRKNTLRIAEEIPEEKYGFKATPETKSVGQLLAHVALTHRFHQQVHAVERRRAIEGFDFPAFMQRVSAEEQMPRSKAEVIALLRSEGEAWATWVEGLSEEFLAEQVTMSPGMEPATKSRFEMLLSPKEHEMHHRGQLMLIQRMVRIVLHLTRAFQARMPAAAAGR